MQGKPIYVFGWPSNIGGAGTKLAHLLGLLTRISPQVTVVPNKRESLTDLEWCGHIQSAGGRVALREDLGEDLHGWALSLCNDAFFKEYIARTMFHLGLKVVWSNEMMWHFPAELGAVLFGWVDTVLYTSPAQRMMLEPGYRHAISAGRTPLDIVELEDPDAEAGVLSCEETGRKMRWVVTGNYIDPAEFPRAERAPDRPFTVGRVSRPDPDKFPDNFPESYEELGLSEPHCFRVLGWSDQVRARWPDHHFDNRWTFLPPGGEPVVPFLHSLDIMIHDVSPRLKESWGRSTVEAMLTGVVPLVPKGGGHHLEYLVPHGIGGFHCSGPEDFSRYARMLQADPALLRRMSRAAHDWAADKLCRMDEHLARWQRVFE
jgi:glycosyltransferase involved in cell wall biosynthesis